MQQQLTRPQQHKSQHHHQQKPQDTVQAKLDVLQSAAMSMFVQQTKDLTQLSFRQERLDKVMEKNAEVQLSLQHGQRFRAQLEAQIDHETERVKQRQEFVQSFEAATHALEARRNRSRNLDVTANNVAARVQKCADDNSGDSAMAEALRKANSVIKGKTAGDFRAQANEAKRRRISAEASEKALRKALADGTTPPSSDVFALIEGWIKTDPELGVLIGAALETTRTQVAELETRCPSRPSAVDGITAVDEDAAGALPSKDDEWSSLSATNAEQILVGSVIPMLTEVQESFSQLSGTAAEQHCWSKEELEKIRSVFGSSANDEASFTLPQEAIASLAKREANAARIKQLEEEITAASAKQIALTTDVELNTTKKNGATQLSIDRSSKLCEEQAAIDKDKADLSTIDASLAERQIILTATKKMVEDAEASCESSTTKLAALAVQLKQIRRSFTEMQESHSQSMTKAQCDLDALQTKTTELQAQLEHTQGEINTTVQKENQVQNALETLIDQQARGEPFALPSEETDPSSTNFQAQEAVVAAAGSKVEAPLASSQEQFVLRQNELSNTIAQLTEAAGKLEAEVAQLRLQQQQ